MDDNNQHLIDVFSQVGESVTALREHRGLTIEEAALQMGITDKRLAAIERGSLPHNVTHLIRLIEAIGGRLAVVPTDNPGIIHCEFLNPSGAAGDTHPIKKRRPRIAPPIKND